MNAGFEPGRTDIIASPPLGAMCVGSYLRSEGHDVKIFDLTARELDEGAREDLVSFTPDIVGLTVLTGTTLKRSVTVSEWAKTRGSKVVWGGPTPSVLPEMVLRQAPVDAVVIGEGEITMAELVERLTEGGSLADVKGIAYVDGGGVVRTEPRPRIPDLNVLPMPMWDGVGDLSRYLMPYHGRSAIPMVTSRGCPGTCTFCYTKTMWGYKWTSRSAEKVVEEIEWLRSIDPRVDGVIFDDDLFAGDPRRIARFCDLLNERNLDIAWNCEIRAKDVKPELVDAMKRGGCKELLLGVESGSQKLLDSLCKGLKVEEIEEAFRIAHEGGLEAVAMLMVGVPGETAEDFRRTRELLRRIRPDGYYFSLYIPAPGTKFIEVAKAHGFEEPKDLEGWAEMGTFSMADYERRSYSSVPKAKVEALIASEQKRIRREKNMTALRSDPIGAIGRTIVRGLGGEPRSPPSDR